MLLFAGSSSFIKLIGYMIFRVKRKILFISLSLHEQFSDCVIAAKRKRLLSGTSWFFNSSSPLMILAT